MPHRRSIILILTALLLARPGFAPAAPLGRSFTYQGQLSQSGVPVEGTVTLRFSLWDAAGSGDPPTGGTMVGAVQTVTGVAVTNGVFSVALNGSDEFGSQAFNGQARWLQVEVCADPGCSSTTVLGPRQAVTGTPYALGPWQTNGTSLSYLGGSVGIGTTTPGHALHIKANAPAIILEDSASPSLQAGYLSFNNGSAETGWMGYGSAGSPDMTLANARSGGDIVLWASGEKLRVDAGGNVGIGTSTPASKLEVRGDIRLGSFGEYFAPAIAENVRVIRGRVGSTGVPLSGTGYTASRTGTGVYVITFSPAFAQSGVPAVTATAEASTGAVFAIINAPLYNNVRIRIVNGSGTAIDGDFDFIVAGIR